MDIISQDTYRSPGRGVNCDDDMVRVVMTFTRREFRRIEACFGTAPIPAVSRPTVRTKRAAQQRKGKSDNRQCSNMVTCSHASFGCANGCKGYSPSPVA